MIAALFIADQGLRTGIAYADHETRFTGQGGAAVDVGLIAWTVIGALLGFGALVAAVRFWERRDEEAAQRSLELARRQEKGEG